MTPAALLKAQSLAKYVQHSGAPQGEFQLALTPTEGFELLDYLASGAMGRCEHQSELETDIEEAKLKGDPFDVLAAWTLLGFQIVRMETLN